MGQIATPVRFLARSGGLTVFLAPSEAVLATSGGNVRIRLDGGVRAPRLQGFDALPGRVNYITSKGSHTDIPRFASVRYSSVYPGIDLVYRGGKQGLEYDFEIAAETDPRTIALRFEGAQKLTIDGQGDLLISVGSEVIRQHRPRAFQERDGMRQDVSCEHQLLRSGAVGFRITDYDPARPLVIDPVLTYSTFLGGNDHYGISGPDSVNGVALDPSGNVYITGATNAVDFPTTPGAYSRSGAGIRGYCIFGPVPQPCSDVFVMKLDPSGTQILYSTYIAGDHIDEGTGISVDAAGNAYVAGSTRSANFPTTAGAIRTTFANVTCQYVDYSPSRHIEAPCSVSFVLKLNPSGSGLIYSTFLGDSGQAVGIGRGEDGTAIVTGVAGPGLPTTQNAIRSTIPAYASTGYVARLNASGSALVYSTYLAAEGTWLPAAIAVESSGSAYVTGQGPPPAVFVQKLDPSGDMIYSTQFGGSGYDQPKGIAVDPEGSAYVVGRTDSPDFPKTPGALAGRSLMREAFVTKVKADGTGLVYSALLGGRSNDEAVAVVLDAERSAYVLGDSSSTDFPITPGAILPCQSFGTSTFLAKIGPDGASLPYSTYLGEGYPTSIARDPAGSVWIAGSVLITEGAPAADFPVTPGAIQPGHGQGRIGFLSKIDFSANRDFAFACIANAANMLSGPVSPGELVALFGEGIGPESPVWLTLDEEGRVATRLGGARVLFDGIEAPLIYVQAHQVNAVVPYAVGDKTETQVQVEYQGRRTDPLTVPVLPATFGVFTLDSTGSGQGAILNEDGTVNSPSNPATEGSVIAIFATGAGQTSPPGVDGQVTVAPYPTPLSQMRVYMNFCGAEPEVQYFGAAPGLVAGVVQVNVKIPLGLCRAPAYANQVYFYGDVGSYPAVPVEFSLK